MFPICTRTFRSLYYPTRYFLWAHHFNHPHPSNRVKNHFRERKYYSNGAMAEPVNSEAAQVGQVRSLPESEKEMPVGKKLRIETEKKEGKRRNMKKKERRRQKKIAALAESCSPEDVLWHDIISMLGKDAVDKAVEDGEELNSPFDNQEEVQLTVQAVSSNGSGIAISPETDKPWAVIVPLTLPGEKIRARIYRSARMYSQADLIEIITPNDEWRDQSRVKCKYFGTCAGCQYQMLSYDKQLELKRDVVVRAYQNYTTLPQESLPPILPTIASPLQYAYRTKITPHFDAPLKSARNGKAVDPIERPDWLRIGFNQVGSPKTMDIEECPIATPTINEALTPVRDDIIKNIFTYKKGVSLLLRDSLDTSVDIHPTSTSTIDKLSEEFNKHICVTDQKATVRETVGNWIFEFTGGSFFQNNNSVLVPLTTYVRDAIFPVTNADTPDTSVDRPTHLVDAYCGAGLFAITLSPHFDTVAGIELSVDSIRSATHNARINGIPPEKCTFHAGDAVDIFAAVSDFPPARTVLLIDPPRKGCDVPFLTQLLKFKPKIVMYVSCNVHTQARDVDYILKASMNASEKYVLESIRGFDLFPQTAHVESVAVLRLTP